MRGAIFQDFSVHATGFSQWLMTDFPERRIHSAKILEGASLYAPKIFSSAGALPSRKTICQSLFAIRYSLSFRLGRSLVLPFFSVPRPTPRFKGRLQIGELVLYKLHRDAAVAELADALA